MNKRTIFSILGLGLLVFACGEDPVTSTGFEFTSNMNLDVELSGETRDTFIDVDVPDREITYVTGRNKLRGELSISLYNRSNGNFEGALEWTDRIYTEETEVRTFDPNSGTWSTQTTTVTNQVEPFIDSSFFVEGHIGANYFQLLRPQEFGEDPKPFYRTRTGLDFQTAKHSERELIGLAGYPEVYTELTGDPDSIQYHYYYVRQVWQLDTMKLSK